MIYKLKNIVHRIDKSIIEDSPYRYPLKPPFMPRLVLPYDSVGTGVGCAMSVGIISGGEAEETAK